jgi:hypothetical protein
MGNNSSAKADEACISRALINAKTREEKNKRYEVIVASKKTMEQDRTRIEIDEQKMALQA